ncbi:MAG: hypothetical protein ACRD3M_15105, partial [Thermoanaerobaculia bacterium]
VLLFAALFLLRTLRLLLLQWLGRGLAARRPPPKEGEMARDPVCGAWFDRRLAVTGRRGGELVEVCSEGCRRRLEAG